MKYSGVEWIGEIPDNWKIRKVKHCFYISKKQAHEENPTILSLARAGVKIRDISNNEGQLAASYENYNPVQPGDLLLNPMDLYSGANCSLSEISGVISPAYVNLRKHTKLNPKFFDYYFKTQYWAMAMFAHGKGVSFDNRWTMNVETVLNYYLPFPTYEEQNNIVEKINQKIKEIDSLIEIENKQIEKLKEYKQAVIDNTISKVEDEIRIKFVCSLNGRIGFRGYKQEDLVAEGEGAITISPSNMQNLKMNYDKCHYLSWFKYEESPEIQLQNGDILFVKTGSTYGKSALVDNLPMEATINPQLLIFKNININNKYFLYALQTNDVKDQVEGFVIGGTIPTISQDKISKIRIKICDNEEQTRIVNYLDEQCDDIDKLIEIKQQKIEQLEEYKKSIIYEYVTGKKEVC